MKAVIPAAGLGTRLLPATKSMPKEMLPIVDKPVIQYVVEEAVASGIEDILIVTGRGKRAIEDHFDRSHELESHLRDRGQTERADALQHIEELARIHYVRQPTPSGLGDAIRRARSFVGEDAFAVLLGDDIILDGEPPIARLRRLHEKVGASCLSVMEVPDRDVHRYGTIEKGAAADADAWRVRRIVEKADAARAPSRLAAMGRYILTPEIFAHLDRIRPGHGGEIQLTDALDEAARAEGLFAAAFKGERLDVGSVEGFLAANVRLASKDPRLREVVAAALAGPLREALDVQEPLP